jgi:hypothetical protein
MVDWPPPDIRHVLQSVDWKTLSEWLADQLGDTPRTRTAAMMMALKAGPTLRPLYELNRICGRAAITWFRDGSAPTPRHTKSLRWIRSYSEELGDDPFGIVWADLKQFPKSIRIAYPDGMDLDASLNAVERHGFATLIWRTDLSPNGGEILEVHCKSYKIKRSVLPILRQLGGNDDGLTVLDFRDNDRARAIRENLGGSLTKATALVTTPNAVDDRVEFNARSGESLANPRSGFQQYASFPGRGRTFHTETMKVTISQRDFSAQLADARLESTKLFFEEAEKVGDWIPFP